MKQIKTIFFILSGVFLLALFTIVVGNNQDLFYSTTHYKARFTDAGGLFVGSFITINGVRAGNISNIDLQDEQIIVSLGIKKDYVRYVNSSSTAVVRTQGLVGDRYIAIYTKQKAEPLPAGSFIPVAGSGMLGGLFSEQGNLSESLASFFNEASVFLSRINNKEDKKDFLKELGEISQQTRKFLSEDKNKDLKEILTHTKSILKKIDKGKGSLGALVNEKSLHNKAVSFLGGKPYRQFIKSFFAPGEKPKTPSPSAADEEF